MRPSHLEKRSRIPQKLAPERSPLTANFLCFKYYPAKCPNPQNPLSLALLKTILNSEKIKFMASSSSFLVPLFFLVLPLSLTIAQAREFTVGGKANAWVVPASSSEPLPLNKWAEANRFQVGDSLVWKYDPEKDSVLLVSREAYLSCNTTDPIASYKDGTTVVALNHSGLYYFISGVADNCQKGEKVIVLVMSERHSRKHLAPAPAPAYSTDLRAPALAPIAGAQDRVVVSRGMLSLMLGLGLLAFGF